MQSRGLVFDKRHTHINIYTQTNNSSSASEGSRGYVTRSQKSAKNIKSVRTQEEVSSTITTAVGRYELRSLTGHSKSMTKNPVINVIKTKEVDGKVKSKVGLDKGGPFNNVVRRQRIVSPITRRKEGKWGTGPLIVMPEDSLLVDLKDYNDDEMEVSKVLLLMNKNTYKEPTLDTKSANHEDLERVVATSKTSETVTNFKPLRNAQKPQDRFKDM